MTFFPSLSFPMPDVSIRPETLNLLDRLMQERSLGCCT
jgi:hypothetical protein